MPESIITKTCPKCKTTKPLADFHRDCNMPDGHHGHCKACKAEYAHSESGKAAYIRGTKKARQNNPTARRARGYIASLIYTGRIHPAKHLMCKCGSQAQEYHHHNGYAEEHKADVIPVCVLCHVRLHSS